MTKCCFLFASMDSLKKLGVGGTRPLGDDQAWMALKARELRAGGKGERKTGEWEGGEGGRERGRRGGGEMALNCGEMGGEGKKPGRTEESQEAGNA